MVSYIKGQNPCIRKQYVLILIVVEDGLVPACGRKFALRGEDDEDAVEATILDLENTTPTVHKFAVKAEAEKAAE